MGEAENIVQRKIVDYFSGDNISSASFDFSFIDSTKIFRINSKGIKGRRSTLPAGFPDLLAIINAGGQAIPLFIEVKASDKTCTNKDQLKFIREMKYMNCDALWCNNLRQVKEYIKCHISTRFANIVTKKER